MRTSDFIPRSLPELLLWAMNFKSKFGVYATALGFTSQEITAATLDLDLIIWAVRMVDESRANMELRTRARDVFLFGPQDSPNPPIPALTTLVAPDPMPLPGAIARLRALAQRIKACAAYTKAMGEDLRIVAPESTPSDHAPTARVRVLPGFHAQIDWTRGSHQAVDIEGRRGEETGFTPLARDMVSPWVDPREPLVSSTPEERQYRLRYVDNDEPVGEYSDIISLVVRA
jgi:hypothetical protein